jgi:DNA-binding MarR family transcriptional regulator
MEEVRDSLSGQAGLLVELLTAALQPDLEAAGLTLACFELLSAVHSDGGKSAQSDIARRLGISPPSLSEAVRMAVKRGLIIQIAVETDARVKQLKLTPKGRAAVRRVLDAVKRVETDMQGGLSSTEIGSAIDILARVNRNLATR